MWRLFERLVARILTERCLRTGSGVVRTQQQHPLDEGHRLTIVPDVVIARGAQARAVLDTKYKLLDHGGRFPNADAYQLVTYCLRLGLGVGHLVYAVEPHDGPDEYRVTSSGVRREVHAVDLRGPVGEIEAQVDDVLARALDPLGV